MKRIAVFPGQGAQAVGMGRALFDAVPEARAVFETVDEALGEKLSALIFDGPIEMLTLTRNAQPALMATSLAAVRAVEARAGRPLGVMVDAAAGHSLGEYSALAAMGALEIGAAARLLRLRGEAMQDAVPAGAGAMAAVLGLDPATALAVAADAEAASGKVCELANDNADGQAVLSGDQAAVEAACAIAKDKGAKRAMLLQVSAPFHCRLMQPAAERLAAALAETAFAAPLKPVVANVTVEPVVDPAALPGLLTRQVTARVRWRETMQLFAAAGATTIAELGAGKVLTGLAKRAVPTATLFNVQGPEDVEALVAALG
jgi:[acyl-carrier-protein] S-malonyltransferase